MKKISELQKDLQKISNRFHQLHADAPRVIGVEGVKHTQENFRNQSFDGQKWEGRKRETAKSKGKKVLSDTTMLKKSIEYDAGAGIVQWGVSLKTVPYAQIHNEGGSIRITDKMRKYFWARHYELKKKLGSKKVGTQNKRAWAMAEEGLFWRNMAMAKGPLKIPKRQYIGMTNMLSMKIRKRLDSLIRAYFQGIKADLK